MPDFRFTLCIAKASKNGYISLVKTPTKEQQREWVRAWDRAGRAMEAMRVEELQSGQTPLPTVMKSFEEIFLKTIRENPAGESSGLVEQQRLFRGLRSS